MTRAARSRGNWTVSAGRRLRLLRGAGLSSLSVRLGKGRGLIADLTGYGRFPAFMGAGRTGSRKTGDLAAVSNCLIVLREAKWTCLVCFENGRVKARLAARCARDAELMNLLMPPGFNLGCCLWFLSTACLILLCLLPFAMAVRPSSAMISARVRKASSACRCCWDNLRRCSRALCFLSRLLLRRECLGSGRTSSVVFLWNVSSSSDGEVAVDARVAYGFGLAGMGAGLFCTGMM